MENISCKWAGEMSFEAEVQGHKIVMDAHDEFGGKNRGPRPKPLLLVALAGCTSMDMISLLTKMKVEIKDYNVNVSGELTEDHPKVYKSIHVEYEFWGKNLSMEKIQKAINLSQEKYCGVSAMLTKTSELSYSVKLYEA
jgi:putative redox protein